QVHAAADGDAPDAFGGDARDHVALAVVLVPVDVEAAYGHDVDVAIAVEVAMGDAPAVAEIAVHQQPLVRRIAWMQVDADIEARRGQHIIHAITIEVGAMHDGSVVQPGVERASSHSSEGASGGVLPAPGDAV